MERVEKTRVALYERVSTEEQAREGVSLPEQKERLELWAKLGQREVAGHYMDRGISGGTDNRPELQRLMLDARMGKFDFVVVTKLDRFFRNLKLLVNYVDELEQLSIHFIATSESLDTSTPHGKFSMQILGVIAEWERGRIGERIKDFRNGLAKRGRWSSGRTPFGYRFNKETKELEIYEPEAEVVRYIFNTYVNETIGEIRLTERLINKKKLTPRWGRRKYDLWTRSAVRHILTHHAYRGGPNDGWQFKCPAIVHADTWYLAQKRRMNNPHFKPLKRSNFDFNGLFRCGLCEPTHTLRIDYDSNGTPKYECPSRRKKLHLDGSPRCTLPRYTVDLLETALMQEIRTVFSDPKRVAGHLKKTLDNLEVERQELQRRLNPLQAEAEGIQKRMEVADTKFEVGRVDAQTYKATIGGLRARLRDIERRQQEQDPASIRQLTLLDDEIAHFRSILDKGIEVFAAEIADELTSNEVSREAMIKEVPSSLAMMTNPRNLMVKYGLLAFVYPDQIELKGSLPIRAPGMSDVSPKKRKAPRISGGSRSI